MNKVIERLLNLLAFLLTAGRPVTADEIRHTVAGYDQGSDEAFRRMFERDKDLLRGLGMPLEVRPTDAWEVEHGYVVPEDSLDLPDPALTDEERAALWLAAQVVRLGGQPSGPEALLKLGGSPMASAGEPLAADLGLEAAELAEVFQAVVDRRELSFEYRGKARTVHPYGMVHRRGHWYLAASDGVEVRTYRIDRATDVRPGDQAGVFERPADFRARDVMLHAPWEAGEEDIEAIVRFDPEVAWWARRQIPGDAPRRVGADGSLEVTLTVANVDAFVGWLLAFEDGAEVRAPDELRGMVVDRVRGVA